jgi:hypothetical protein
MGLPPTGEDGLVNEQLRGRSGRRAIVSLVVGVTCWSIVACGDSTPDVVGNPLAGPLQALAQDVSGDTGLVVAVGDCSPAAATVVDGQLKFFVSDGKDWVETPIDMRGIGDDPDYAISVMDVEVGDFAPGSGHQSFLIHFMAGYPFGSILAQKDCEWSLVDIVQKGSIKDPDAGFTIIEDGQLSWGVIFLEYWYNFGLVGFSRAGNEKADLQLEYDPDKFAFIASPMGVQ